MAARVGSRPNARLSPEIEIINDLFSVSGNLFRTSEIAFFAQAFACCSADMILVDDLRRIAVK